VLYFAKGWRKIVLSERKEKTYISIHEFISSWEKEIYELTNLDYFSYLMINFIGNEIETGYLGRKQKIGQLHIESEDIGTLAFNIGDTLESFLEHNCFGDCTLSCPTKLHEKMNPEDIEFDSPQFHLFKYVKSDGLNKKQFFLTDLLNYVVLDTLYDFYNYEIGLDLDDSDIGLMQFADFITSIMEIFIETKGQQYLNNHKESASDLFEKLIQDSEQNWDDLLQPPFDDDIEDSEEWKMGEYQTAKLITEFLNQADQLDYHFENDERIIKYFRSYLEDYAGIDSVEEITFEDLEEFFIFWLIRETILETEIQPQAIRDTMSRFFKWLDLTKDINLNGPFSEVVQKHYQVFNDSIQITREYFANNSLIDGILASNDPEANVVSSLFTVDDISDNGFVRLRDLFLKDKYSNVQITLESDIKVLKGMIIDATIKPTMYGWRLINLDYVFPKSARAYLH
jgi:hypothetical protein